MTGTVLQPGHTNAAWLLSVSSSKGVYGLGKDVRIVSIAERTSQRSQPATFADGVVCGKSFLRKAQKEFSGVRKE